MPRRLTYEIQVLEDRVTDLLAGLQRAEADNQGLKAREKSLHLQISQAGVNIGAIKQSLESNPLISCTSAAAPENRLLSSLHEKEEGTQQLLLYLGLASAGLDYEELYTTRMLRALVANPAKQQELLNRTKEQAMENIASVAQRCALLIARYDAPQLPNGYSPKKELDDLIDNCVQATLFRGFLEPLHSKQRRNTAFMGINMVTGEMEQYPPGWFLQVVKAMRPTAEQKTVLNATWVKAKVDLEALMKQHDELAQQLLAIQREQAAGCREFNEQADALSDKMTQAAVRLMRRRNRTPAATPASQEAAALQQTGKQPHSNKPQQVTGTTGNGVASLSSEDSNCSTSTVQLLSLDQDSLSYTPSDTQKQLEAKLDSTVVRMNLLCPALAMVNYNTFTRKQLALALINAFPFVPDTFAITEAFTQLED